MPHPPTHTPNHSNIRTDTTLLQLIADRSIATMHLFKPQNIANMLWAFAKVGYHPGMQFLELAGVLRWFVGVVGVCHVHCC